jgi:hypothetical protein
MGHVPKFRKNVAPSSSRVDMSYQNKQTWETGKNMYVAASALVKLAGLAFHIFLHWITKNIKFHFIPYLFI